MYEPKEPRRAYTIDEGPEGKMGWPTVKYADFFSAHIHGHSCSMLQPAVLNGPRRRCGLLPDYCGNLFSHQSPLYFARIIFIERPCLLEIAETTLATFSSCEDLLNFTLYMTLTFEHDQDEPTWEISGQKSFFQNNCPVTDTGTGSTTVLGPLKQLAYC